VVRRVAVVGGPLWIAAALDCRGPESFVATGLIAYYPFTWSRLARLSGGALERLSLNVNRFRAGLVTFGTFWYTHLF